MSPEGWYRVEEFAPDTYQITEGGRWKMFLFIGEDRALSLDGGVGIGDLRGLEESLTDRPIDHVLTHAHWDHVGAAHQWASVGVHPKGKNHLADDHTERCRQVFLDWNGLPFPSDFDPETYTIAPGKFGWEVKEGDVIDLGGRKLTVFDTPGHSPCSISLIDDKEGVLISGDLVKPLQPLNLRVTTAVLSDYAPSLRKLEAYTNDIKWVCSGHTDAFPDSSIIGEMAQFMEELEAGKREPPQKMQHKDIGQVDVYFGTRFSVWIQDHARR